MPSKAILGCIYGDEAKAKMVDVFAESAEIIVRFQGGNNAGHTVYANGEKYVFHLVPSGILQPDKICILAPGVVIDPFQLLDEMEKLKQRGINFDNRFFIDPRANIVLPLHQLLDNSRENDKNQISIGTTKRGIGPCYADSTARYGLKIYDLFDQKILLRKLTEIYAYHNMVPDKDLTDRLFQAGKKLDSCQLQTSYFLDEAYAQGREIIFEGAQGTLLDITFGTYPFVTSSHTISGGISAGCGFSPQKIDNIIGVFKSYFSRVGAGPFPTELFDETGKQIRNQGNEFGSTTGRPRRCGWFDAIAAKYSIMINGVNEIALTLLDVLSGIGEIKICTGYQLNDKIVDQFPYSAEELDKVKPVYTTVAGWDQDISQVKSYDDFPENAQKYIQTLENILGKKITVISVGPDRDQTIFR